eukprot:2226491-Rhodomonas_salina.2
MCFAVTNICRSYALSVPHSTLSHTTHRSAYAMSVPHAAQHTRRPIPPYAMRVPGIGEHTRRRIAAPARQSEAPAASPSCSPRPPLQI